MMGTKKLRYQKILCSIANIWSYILYNLYDGIDWAEIVHCKGEERGNAFIQANRAQMRRKEKECILPHYHEKCPLCKKYVYSGNTFSQRGTTV